MCRHGGKRKYMSRAAHSYTTQRKVAPEARFKPYNQDMARGWESKSVEDQQAEAQPLREKKPKITAEQRLKHNQRRGLELARARVMQQLGAITAHTPDSPYAEQLRRSLADLDARLAALN